MEGFPGGSAINNLPAIAGDVEEGMTTHSSILAWETHGQRNQAGYSPWGCKESDMTKQQVSVDSTQRGTVK